MPVHLLTRYDRHCLDTLLDTSTEARLRVEGYVFTLTDLTEYSREDFGLPPQPEVISPRDEEEEDRKFWQENGDPREEALREQHERSRQAVLQARAGVATTQRQQAELAEQRAREQAPARPTPPARRQTNEDKPE